MACISQMQSYETKTSLHSMNVMNKDMAKNLCVSLNCTQSCYHHFLEVRVERECWHGHWSPGEQFKLYNGLFWANSWTLLWQCHVLKLQLHKLERKKLQKTRWISSPPSLSQTSFLAWPALLELHGIYTVYKHTLQAECRDWDVNEVVFSAAMWPIYQPLMRADFTLFDQYKFEHQGTPVLQTLHFLIWVAWSGGQKHVSH